VLKPTLDPITTLPPGIIRGFTAVILGALGVSISYTTCVVRAFETYLNNPFVAWTENFDLNLVGRLHNDDVHTYGDVTRALRKVGFSDASAVSLTNAVDKQGLFSRLSSK
jgi:hypothetical protein